MRFGASVTAFNDAKRLDRAVFENELGASEGPCCRYPNEGIRTGFPETACEKSPAVHIYKPPSFHPPSLSPTTMNPNRPRDDPPPPPPGRTGNTFDLTDPDEVRGLTIDDLPANADPFLEPLDNPLPGRSHVYVVWNGRVPGLYYRWCAPMPTPSIILTDPSHLGTMSSLRCTASLALTNVGTRA